MCGVCRMYGRCDLDFAREYRRSEDADEMIAAIQKRGNMAQGEEPRLLASLRSTLPIPILSLFIIQLRYNVVNTLLEGLVAMVRYLLVTELLLIQIFGYMEWQIDRQSKGLENRDL